MLKLKCRFHSGLHIFVAVSCSGWFSPFHTWVCWGFCLGVFFLSKREITGSTWRGWSRCDNVWAAPVSEGNVVAPWVMFEPCNKKGSYGCCQKPWHRGWVDTIGVLLFFQAIKGVLKRKKMKKSMCEPSLLQTQVHVYQGGCSTLQSLVSTSFGFVVPGLFLLFCFPIAQQLREKEKGKQRGKSGMGLCHLW